MGVVFNGKVGFITVNIQKVQRKANPLVFPVTVKVGVIGPRPDTLAPIQDDIKHMENIGKGRK